MFSKLGRIVLFVCTVIAVLGTGGRFAAAEEAAQGRVIYLHYCASCHGINADGNGPVARALKEPPTNLRLLSDLYGNPLQEDKVARAIDGRAEVKAHGPRDMPVWGEQFSAQSHGDERQVKERITKLVAYLQSIQTGARSASR
ncbi:MAG TPA: cytochrome c [Candidatus Binataceae bacterium]|nr:cytochrome c [Candidatus Binataceae bacterium]